jgi:ferritin
MKKTDVEFLRWLAFEGGSDVKRLLKIADKLEELDERDAVLTALEAGGVDNWEWYDASLEDAGL